MSGEVLKPLCQDLAYCS